MQTRLHSVAMLSTALALLTACPKRPMPKVFALADKRIARACKKNLKS